MATYDELCVLFPQLASSGCSVTSPYDRTYNCVAWLAGDTERWWEPSPVPVPGLYWPAGLPTDPDRRAYDALFRSWSYSRCTDGELEPGVEKLAIWFEGEAFKHVARQLENGWWTSKLGYWHDVSHRTLVAIMGSGAWEFSGAPIFMKRRRARSHPLPRGAPDLGVLR